MATLVTTNKQGEPWNLLLLFPIVILLPSNTRMMMMSVGLFKVTIGDKGMDSVSRRNRNWLILLLFVCFGWQLSIMIIVKLWWSMLRQLSQLSPFYLCFCDQIAEQRATTKNGSWLLGNITREFGWLNNTSTLIAIIIQLNAWLVFWVVVVEWYSKG